MNDQPPRGGVNLHVSHSWGGGLAKWVADFAAADERSENLVLECLGTVDCYGAGHQLVHARTREVLASWTTSSPINEVQVSNPVYAAHLGDLVKRYDVDHLYVSSLTGHTLDVFDIDLPLTRVHHDYFPFCPALHCYRGAVCSTCGEDELQACRSNADFRPMSSPSHYIALRERLIEAYRRPHVRHVAPSPSVWRQLWRLDQRYFDLDFEIIEHGVDCERGDLFGGAPEGRRLRIGMLGHLQWPKGLNVLRADFDRLRLIADFVLLGAGAATPEFQHRWGVSAVQDYAYGELPQLLEKHEVDLALFLSVVPETFSYTLSEVWAFGIPPVATPAGSLGDRIQNRVNGFLVSQEGDHLMDLLLHLDGNRQVIRRMSREVRQLPIRTTEQMVRDYYSLRSTTDDGAKASAPSPAAEPRG